jgi:hypothetical protein
MKTGMMNDEVLSGDCDISLAVRSSIADRPGEILGGRVIFLA